MRMWRASVLVFLGASVAHSEFLAERLQQHRMGRRQPQLDLNENSNLESFELTPQFIQKGESKKTQMRECGDGHKGLLTMAVDNSEPEAAVLVHAQLSRSAFAAFTGATLEKEFKLKDVQIPLETVDDRCFLVKLTKDFGTVFCARNLHSRNEWMNYLHEAILCEETGVKGKLPAEAGEEMEKEEALEQRVPVAEPSGINIHLEDSPLGKPQVLVNGVTVKEMEGIQRAQAVRDVTPRPPSPSIFEFPNPAVSVRPLDPAALGAEGEAKTAETIQAINEAAAEQRRLTLKDPRVPQHGFAKMSMQ